MASLGRVFARYAQLRRRRREHHRQRHHNNVCAGSRSGLGWLSGAPVQNGRYRRASSQSEPQLTASRGLFLPPPYDSGSLRLLLRRGVRHHPRVLSRPLRLRRVRQHARKIHRFKTCGDERLGDVGAAADDDLQYQGRLRCPCATASAGGCTAEYFSDATIAKVVDETTFEEYIGARALLPIARSTRKAFEEAQSALKPDDNDDNSASSRGRALLGKQLKNQMPDARMCAKCGFGPVDHMKCSDLRAHHGQVNEDGSIIDNSCRRCGWFSAERQDWPIWDGKIHDDHKVNQKEEVELLASSLETAEAAAKQAQEKLELAQKVAARDAREASELRALRAKDRADLDIQKREAKAVAVQKAKLEDQLAGFKAAESRRNKVAAAAAMERLAEERGYGRIEPAVPERLLFSWEKRPAQGGLTMVPVDAMVPSVSRAQQQPSAGLPMPMLHSVVRDVRTPTKLEPLPPSRPQPPNRRPRTGARAAFAEKEVDLSVFDEAAVEAQLPIVNGWAQQPGGRWKQTDAWDRAGLPWGEVARMDRIEELRLERAKFGRVRIM